VAATSTRSDKTLSCDACGGALDASEARRPEGSGHGLFLTVRGDQVVREEPPLCARCALSIGMTFLVRLHAEEEEG
jgi:hypothetical protein